MPNRLEELASSLGPAATRRRDRPRKRRRAGRSSTAPAPPAPPAPLASPVVTPPPSTRTDVASKALSSRTSRPMSRAAAALDYTVPGVVAPLAQPTSMVCWATTTTMMLMWREQASMTIEAAMGKVGASYLAKVKANQGLGGSEKAAFLASVGLTYEYPQSLSAAGWEALLRRFGPLWVTTDEKPGAGFAIHARLMTGIHGDGSFEGTTVDIVDPAGGRTYTENLARFTEKYESEALDPSRPTRIQIVHWPHDVAMHVARLHAVRSKGYAQSLSAGRFATVDDAEFEPAYREGSDGSAIPMAHSAFAHGLKAPRTLGAADVRWAPDAESIDYRHLASTLDTTPFELTGEVLDRLARFNRFELPAGTGRVVFALRGCTLDADVARPQAKVTVREIEPNHIDFRCVLGVWDRGAGTIAAFQGSTVPNWEYMEVYREDHGRKANLLPTGLYHLTVGTHRARKKDASGRLVDNPGRVQGALRNDAQVVVLRSEDDLTYSVHDTWDHTVANDNIHPGIVTPQPGSSTVPDFSSAGCSTIPGTSVGDTPAGAWADFRAALGLNNANPRANDGQSFPYLLLTGREARLAAGGNTGLGRLRFGSAGEDVRQLQSALASHARKYFKGKHDGRFGARTAMAVIRYQKDLQQGAADGIVSPTDATALGFTLSPTAAAVSGPKGMDAVGTIKDLAVGLFKKWTKRPEEGRFKLTSETAEVIHEDTAATQQWKRKTAQFTLMATQPGLGKKDVARLNVTGGGKSFHFRFQLSFEFNGFDIRGAEVTRLVQASTGLTEEQFTIAFNAKQGAPPKAEQARIDFFIRGTWNPKLGEKAFDFTGKLEVNADGFIDLDVDKNERVSVEFTNGTTFANVQETKLAGPHMFRFLSVVLFENPGQFEVSAKWVERIKQRLEKLKSESPVRYERLRSGAIPVLVEGYASPTGKEKMNRKLSAQRAKAVADILRQELSSAARINEAAHSEPSPTTPPAQEKEDFLERRVEIRFEVAE